MYTLYNIIIVTLIKILKLVKKLLSFARLDDESLEHCMKLANPIT